MSSVREKMMMMAPTEEKKKTVVMNKRLGNNNGQISRMGMSNKQIKKRMGV
jgi:hypothetical protein